MFKNQAVAKTPKEYRYMGFALLLMLLSGLVIYYVFAHNFKTTGQWWRGRVKNSFVSGIANIDTVYQQEYEKFGKTAADHIHEIRVFANVHFNVSNKKRSATIYLKKFPWLNFDKADEYINEFKKNGLTTTIFYDPADPTYVVKNKSDIPGGFTSTSIIELNLIVLIVLIALFSMGMAGVYSFFKREKHRAPNQPISEKRKAYLKKKYIPEIEETKTVLSKRVLETKLSGNLLSDYYSGALEHNCVQMWHGFYCEVFLFAAVVVVAFQEDKGYYVREYSLPDVLKKKYKTHLMASFFGEEEQELEQQFFDAVAKVYEGREGER